MTVLRATVVTLLICASFGTAASGQTIPTSKPQNLQVLPKDMSSARVGKLMKGIAKDLGVECSHCHVENHDTQKVDYVSDENPAKQTARVMIAMLDDINNKYLAQLGRDQRYSVPVTCGSCHQGQSSPPAFEPRT
jgi:hypothetical protein